MATVAPPPPEPRPLEQGLLGCEWAEPGLLLWLDLMEEQQQLDAWLRLAEEAAASLSPAPSSHQHANEQLQRFQRLVGEAPPRLQQLDRLLLLTRRFHGDERPKLMEAAADCSRRWSRLEELLVSRWEAFSARRLQLLLWLDEQRGGRGGVFGDSFSPSGGTDSGCPSETLPEDGGLSPFSALSPEWGTSSPRPPPPSPPPLEPPGLEWDPSVDVGPSLSHEDADSSYFSAGTGWCGGDFLRGRSYSSGRSYERGRSYSRGRSYMRGRSYLSSLDSSSDLTDQEEDSGPEDWAAPVQPRSRSRSGSRSGSGSRSRSRSGSGSGFDGGRVEAWLQVQRTEGPETCSRSQQTGPVQETPPAQRRWTSTLLFLLFLLLFLACLMFFVLPPPPCHRSNAMNRHLHLALRYVDGPPPT